jgi:hypothetical protein
MKPSRLFDAKGIDDRNLQISDAIGVDDSKFELRARMGEPTEGGRVDVKIIEVKG